MKKFKKKILKKYIPRYWSNDELRKIVPYLPSDSRILNVSGWEDNDKEGDCYCNYFYSSLYYHISNHPTDKVRGNALSDITIDLNMNLPKELVGAYDGVFNHTVLEHISNPEFAFKQMALLTTDWIISVVPFIQKLHFEDKSYNDYYRFTPFVMRQLHEKNGFTVLYENYTPKPSLDIYLFYMGTKNPKNYITFPKHLTTINTLNYQLGNINAKMLLQNIIAKFLIKYIL